LRESWVLNKQGQQSSLYLHSSNNQEGMNLDFHHFLDDSLDSESASSYRVYSYRTAAQSPTQSTFVTLTRVQRNDE